MGLNPSAFWADQGNDVYHDTNTPLEMRYCENDEDFPLEISAIARDGMPIGLALNPIDCIRVYVQLQKIVGSIFNQGVI